MTQPDLFKKPLPPQEKVHAQRCRVCGVITHKPNHDFEGCAGCFTDKYACCINCFLHEE